MFLSGYFYRLRRNAAFRWCQIFQHPQHAPLTFCIAHFNNAVFLEISLHAIRRHYPDARILVADADSSAAELAAAHVVCKAFRAELHVLCVRHKHTALLNYLFRQIRSDIGVFLDQDCVLLESLNPLLGKMTADTWLVGPRDKMRLTHPNIPTDQLPVQDTLLRDNPKFIHASMMVVNAAQLRPWTGRRPFSWKSQWGIHPGERYYGLTERIRRKSPQAILSLDSRHTGYGLGMVYLLGKHPIAYHNWYSGRVFGNTGKIDALETDWLRAEMARFIKDYWAGTLNLDLPGKPALPPS